MHRRHGFRILTAFLVGVLFAAVGVRVSGALDAAAAPPKPVPTVAVTPQTNLVDLQSVTVVGSNFSPNALVGTVECNSTAVDVNSCDLSTLVYATADASGGVLVNRTVRRIIAVGGKSVDCKAPVGCILGVGNVSDFTEASGAVISFDPAVPPVVTKINAVPSTNLQDHELVSVVGQGFNPGSFVSVVECATSASFSCAYETQRQAEVSATGTILLRNFALERKFLAFGDTGIETIDCAATPHACVLQTGFGGFGGAPITAPLSFNPAIPSSVPKITVTPSTKLGDLDLVKVEGFGFLPGVAVNVAQCSTATFACDPGAVSVTPGFLGHFLVTMAVHRLVASQAPGSSIVSIDCAKSLGTCAIRVQAQGSLTSPSVPLGFNPTKPSVVPSMTIDPNRPLNDNQKVGVTLNGFAAFRQIAVVECSSDAVTEQNLAYCDGATALITTTPASGGPPSVSFFVRRAISGQNGLVDCRTAGACVLVALPYQFFGYFGGGGGGGGIAVGGGLSVSKAAPNGATANPAGASRALPAPDSAGRAAQAAPGSSIPGIAVAPLSFR
jgi:hypothetical protein